MSSGKLSTFDLIDRLELMVSNAKTIPLYNRVMVEKEELIKVLGSLRDSIPADLQQARQLLAVEQEIIDESKRQAEETTRDASQNARATIENANSQAQSTIADAQARAAETLRTATDQANAMVADAQARSSALVADAQARAQQLVADSEIIARAQAEAQEMLESTHRECEDFSARIHGAVSQMMDHADVSLAQQLDALRALRQEITSNQ